MCGGAVPRHHFRASEQSTQQVIEVEQLVRLGGRSGARRHPRRQRSVGGATGKPPPGLSLFKSRRCLRGPEGIAGSHTGGMQTGETGAVAQGKRVGEPQAGAAGKRRRSGGPEAAFDELVSEGSRGRLQPLLRLHCTACPLNLQQEQFRKQAMPIPAPSLPARPAVCRCSLRMPGACWWTAARAQSMRLMTPASSGAPPALAASGRCLLLCCDNVQCACRVCLPKRPRHFEPPALLSHVCMFAGGCWSSG